MSYRCPICSEKQTKDANLFYADLRDWIDSALTSTDKEDYQDVVMDVRDRTLFPESGQCFCEGKIVDEWNSSLRTILTMRFEKLLEYTGESPQDAVKDSRRAIFGKEGDYNED